MEIIITPRKINDLAPLFLRLGMAVVFLYFGISQLITPEAFVGWLPPEVSMIPLSGRTFVLLNGGFETFFGTLLVLGLWRRVSAFLLGAHLMGITFTIGWTEIGFRDFGLAVAGLTIAMIETDKYSLDYWLSKRGHASGESKEEYKESYSE